MCDQCATSIFNGHFFCIYCGFTVCLECFDLRRKNRRLRGINQTFSLSLSLIELLIIDSKLPNQDENQWYFCTNGYTQHLPSNLKYAQYIPPHSNYSSHLIF